MHIIDTNCTYVTYICIETHNTHIYICIHTHISSSLLVLVLIILKIDFNILLKPQVKREVWELFFYIQSVTEMSKDCEEVFSRTICVINHFDICRTHPGSTTPQLEEESWKPQCTDRGRNRTSGVPFCSFDLDQSNCTTNRKCCNG